MTSFYFVKTHVCNFQNVILFSQSHGYVVFCMNIARSSFIKLLFLYKCHCRSLPLTGCLVPWKAEHLHPYVNALFYFYLTKKKFTIL
jgi:hypothetical protein